MSSYHDTRTQGFFGGGVRTAAERHLRAAIARGDTTINAWTLGVGDTETGRVLIAWRDADLREVAAMLAADGITASVRTATAEELAAAGGHELRGAMGERGVDSARVVEVTP